jgi:hypothetical protein
VGDNKDITHKPSKGAIADAIGALFFIHITTSNGTKNRVSRKSMGIFYLD